AVADRKLERLAGFVAHFLHDRGGDLSEVNALQILADMGCKRDQPVAEHEVPVKGTAHDLARHQRVQDAVDGAARDRQRLDQGGRGEATWRTLQRVEQIEGPVYDRNAVPDP